MRIGLPHTSTADDTYKGFFIPRGALIMPNIWLYTRDPATYKDPETFNPARFLGENPEYDPHGIVFGFGRRICPGRVLADSSIFLALACSLAVFNISNALDGQGKPIPPKIDLIPGIITHPKPFQYSLSTRDERAAALIRSAKDELPVEKTDAPTFLNTKWEHEDGSLAA